MAFLDNSGDIILDAVLTDLGRERLSRGDGSFRITKFAFGDDEIDYSLYRNANSSLGAHPSGSAYYDIQILQSPVLEAFTNNSSFLKSKLLSVGRTNVLYLPVLAVAQAAQGREDFYSGSYLVAVDENTQGPSTTNAIAMNTAGIFHGASGYDNDPSPLTIDQGLNTSEISNRNPLDADLVETQYMVEIDNRFGGLVDQRGNRAPVSFVDDDNVATYFFSVGTDAAYFEDMSDTTILSAISGPRGTRFIFKIASSVELATSDFLFTRLGSTTSLPAQGGGTVSSVKFIDTHVRISGVTTGYRLDIPIRFIKSP
jgi:hypothetical protein|tara:strand:+ start:11629 stop:12567 length:939 start_codon:yes stop_codon:yes gene_type:complete